MVKVLITTIYSAANGAGIHNVIVEAKTREEADEIVQNTISANQPYCSFNYKALILN